MTKASSQEITRNLAPPIHWALSIQCHSFVPFTNNPDPRTTTTLDSIECHFKEGSDRLENSIPSIVCHTVLHSKQQFVKVELQ